MNTEKLFKKIETIEKRARTNTIFEVKNVFEYAENKLNNKFKDVLKKNRNFKFIFDFNNGICSGSYGFKKPQTTKIKGIVKNSKIRFTEILRSNQQKKEFLIIFNTENIEDLKINLLNNFIKEF